MSDYLENKLLDHVLKNTAYTPPEKVYLALFTSDPTDAGTGTEVSGGAYTRQEIAFGAASSGTSSTTADIAFPVATANWGNVTHIGIYDAATAGNLLFHGPLEIVDTILERKQVVFAEGDLTVIFD
jgi:hypothetical protein